MTNVEKPSARGDCDVLPHTHDRVGIVELPIEGMTDPTEETDGSYAGTLRCSKTASMTETEWRDIDAVKRTHLESFCRTGVVDKRR